jgi:ribosomal protein L14E/L6E/L27E
MENTKVRIKLKGQFYGKVGTIVKRVNQYSFGVKFDDIRGVHPFGHRNLEIVDANYTDKSIKSEALEKVGNELQQIKDFAQSEIERYSKYNSNAAVEGAACCKRFLALINAVLHDN